MEAKKDSPATIDEYIAQYPEDLQQILVNIRAVIKETAPDAEERISYGMPAFYLKNYLVWFAVNKHHIGIYPKTTAMLESIEELASYKGTKGSVHFPLDQPMPYDLLSKIVKVRVAETQK